MTQNEISLTRVKKSWIHDQRSTPLSIAHRGASAYAFDNTLKAFQLAHELGAQMWEVDIRLTSDRVPIAFHDETFRDDDGNARRVSELTADTLQELTAKSHREVSRFSAVVELASVCGAGIYLDAKDSDAAKVAIEMLLASKNDRVIVGANTVSFARHLIETDCPYPVSLLVQVGQDPFALVDACGADIVHPCWESAGDRPDQLLDDVFFEEAKRRNLAVVTWHEERRSVMKALIDLPVLGICSNQPEMVFCAPKKGPFTLEIVCHRGANKIAPENTLSSARAAWAAGFEYVEIDVRETADGHLMVLHDASLERTTSGIGNLKDKYFADIAHLSAGSWFDTFYCADKIPELDQILDLAGLHDGGLYVELKDADPVKTAKTVLARLPADRVFFWSFNQDWLEVLCSDIPEARLMARREDFPTLIECLSGFDADVIEFNARNANAKEIETVQKRGKKVMIAHHGSEADVIARLLSLKPDMLNVDDPFLVRRLMTHNQKDQEHV
ncbi:Glycerophosphoryl diester phosphodiesterase [Labrenzia sp. THAF82]|uniref:glycerophosphodiester phosphodiesterase n=1 Tax=Labrenzia sp. THAF82 TaxID=2587861 RepID=UPI001268EF09|nr:glycerophosphodiester phosphodiesterase family protein [Labrenzia sp. THAF82]QFT31441.1 Glycerophosphoryl diester phosphodiesterase [Labrenzia sp. THAF82]